MTDEVQDRMKIEDIQGDWWWSYWEEATAGEVWHVEGDRITADEKPLHWSEIPEGIGVDRTDGTFIVVEPGSLESGGRPAHLYLADEEGLGYHEAGSLTPLDAAEAAGWTQR